MEIILLKKIENLGSLGDTVQVKSGYARNYLIPQGKAVFATQENRAEFEKRREELERLAVEDMTVAEQRQLKLENLVLTIPVKMAREDKMFGSVGNADIIKAIEQSCGEKVRKKEIHLPNPILRELGQFQVTILLHADISVTIELNIVAEQ